MPEDNPCEQEPCKSKLQAYERDVRRGREIERALAFLCLTKSMLKETVQQIFILWLVLLIAVMVCFALVFPPQLCTPLVWALVIVSAALAIYSARLIWVTERTQRRMRDCTNQEFTILLSWQDARDNCPKECVPDLVDLDCNC